MMQLARAKSRDGEAALERITLAFAGLMARLPGERRRYAETLLKTQLASAGPLLGCRWTGGAAEPLATRIGMLSRPPPTRTRRRLGLAVVICLGTAALGVARAAQPEQPPWPALVMTFPMTLLIDIDPGSRTLPLPR